MSELFFPIGSDAPKLAREGIIAYLNYWFMRAPYRGMLPSRISLKVIEAGSREKAGIMVTVRSDPDAETPWLRKVTSGDNQGKRVIECTHQFILNIKADSKSADKESVSKVAGVIRLLFALNDDSEERQDLNNRGVKFCIENIDGTDLNVSGFDEETLETSQKIALRCNTDTLLD